MATETVGVIPARFQVPELHEGHLSLINRVFARHKNVLIVLASTGGEPTSKNPLSFAVREAMVRESYPNARVIEIIDHPVSPAYWSVELDALIKEAFPNANPTLYGSRDSFLKVYSGSFPTEELENRCTTSGTEIRNGILLPQTREGREALIWRERERSPILRRSATLAIRDGDCVLLELQQRHGGFLSFPGGDPEPGELEYSVIDDLLTEGVLSAIQTKEHKSLGLEYFTDPRYRGTADVSVCTLFQATYVSGTTPEPAFEWTSIHQFLARLVPYQRGIGQMLLEYWNEQ